MRRAAGVALACGLAAGCAAPPAAVEPVGTTPAGDPAARWLARFEAQEARIEAGQDNAREVRPRLHAVVRDEVFADAASIRAALAAIADGRGTARARRCLAQTFIPFGGRPPAAREPEVLSAAVALVIGSGVVELRRAAAGCLAIAAGSGVWPPALPPLDIAAIPSLLALVDREHDRAVIAWVLTLLDAFVRVHPSVRAAYQGWLADPGRPDRRREHALRALALAESDVQASGITAGEFARWAATDPAPAVRAEARGWLVRSESRDRMFERLERGPAHESEAGRSVVVLGSLRAVRGGAEAILRSEDTEPDPHLDADLASPEPRLRAWGAERLAESGAAHAVPRLVRLAETDPDPLVRVAAIDCLAASARLPGAEQAFAACARLVAAVPTPTERLAAAQALWGLIVFAPDDGVLAERALAARDALLAASTETRQAVAAWVEANRAAIGEALTAEAIDTLMAELRR